MASAANRTITGVVISGEDNEPLIGASVYVHTDELKKAGASQTSLGTITDIDGKFTLSLPSNSVLAVTYVGFSTKNIPVNNQNAIQIVMKKILKFWKK